jgi:hypothetical protein
MFGERNKWQSAVYIDDRRLVEAVVGFKSSVVGMKAGDSLEFRKEYGGFVVAVHRNGAPVMPQHGLLFEPGDSLLILTTDSFVSKFTRDSTFAVIRLVASFRQRRHKYTPILGSLALVLVIAISATMNEPEYGNISILKTALCGCMFMAITGCSSQIEMRYIMILSCIQFYV